MPKHYPPPRLAWSLLPAAAALLLPATGWAQTLDDDEIFILTPFEVQAGDDVGYVGSSTLAGNRLRTRIEDVGASISIYTRTFLEDISATDNQTLLAFGLNTEVGGARGNFVGADNFGLENANLERPNNNTRVRGLTFADNTRNFYLTDVPWNGYNIERVEVQRGANSVLFGVGSPAGIINASTIEAGLRESSGRLQVRFDRFGSFRSSLDYNQVLIEDELGVRVSLLEERTKYRQKPAFNNDRRGFITATYAPEFLNRDEMTLRLKGNYERGRIRSNSPRSIAPTDRITPWFTPVGQSGFQGEFANIADWGLGGRLVDQINEDGIGTIGTSRFNAWVDGGSGNDPIYVYVPHSTDVALITERSVNSRGSWFAVTEDGEVVEVVPNDGSGFNGQIQGTVRGVGPVTINDTNRAAAEAALPFQGFWRASSFTNTDHFDFFNHLIDGDTKVEKKNFDVYEFDLMHTFMNNRFGYNLSYFKQEYESEFNPVLGQVFVPSIYVDIGMWDITSTPDNLVPNPHAGQAYADWNFGHVGSNESTYDRDSKRAQAFVTIDIPDLTDGDSWFTRFLGRHDVVGVLQNQDFERKTRNFRPAGWSREYIADRAGEVPGTIPPAGWRLDELESLYGSTRAGTARVYLEATGPNATGLQPFRTINLPSGTVNVQAFNATPLPGFDQDAAAQPWEDPWARALDPDATNPQARNPDNYVGWVPSIGAYNMVLATDSDGAREYLTRSRSVFTEEADTVAGVWSGHFWDGVVVGMYGLRRDKVEETWISHDYRNDGNVFDPSRENRDIRSTTVRSSNWSVKLNASEALRQITGIGEQLPFNVHLLYAEGEVQTPDPTRVDVFGRTLENATGKTEDASVMLVAKDGRWSFRATRYETSVKDAISTASVNREKWRLEQVLSQGSFIAGLIETNAQDYTADWLTLSPAAQAAGFDNEADYRRQIMAPAWRSFEAHMFNEFPLTRNWYRSEFQPGDRTAPNVLFPDGATIVEDQVSKGWEFELTANPTRNWNIAFNASRTQAIRDNVPGDDFGAVVDLILDELAGPAGQLPIWWNEGPPVKEWLDPFVGELITARALNGSPQPEIRKWKANLVTNYSFDEGTLRGFGVGGAYRYESSQTYGFQPIIVDAETGAIGLDLDQPFSDSSRNTFDLWVSYGRPINERFDWRIQVHVFNAFGRNKLVPLWRNPDGSFGQMGIREGRSWAVTNTFSF